jgi:hypothetical protein
MWRCFEHLFESGDVASTPAALDELSNRSNKIDWTFSSVKQTIDILGATLLPSLTEQEDKRGIWLLMNDLFCSFTLL